MTIHPTTTSAATGMIAFEGENPTTGTVNMVTGSYEQTDNWQFKWSDLPAVKVNDNGTVEAYEYKWVEKGVYLLHEGAYIDISDDYTSTETEEGFVNTAIETVSVEASKVFKGNQPADEQPSAVQFTLYRRDTQAGSGETEDVEVTKDAHGNDVAPQVIVKNEGWTGKVNWSDASHMHAEDFSADPVTIRVFKDSEPLAKITTLPNMGVYAEVTMGTHNWLQNDDLVVNVGDVTVNFTGNYAGAPETKTTTAHLYLNADTDITLTGSGASLVTGVRLYDTEPGAAAALDDQYEERFELSNENSWSTTLRLKTMEITATGDDGNQNISYYDYYFKETETNPSGYYVELTPDVNKSNRLSTEVTIQAENKKIPDFYVKKEWFDSKDPDNFPEVRFTLYQGVVGNDGKLQQGQVFVGENGESYVDIPLNSDNGWSWKCPGYLPETNASGQNVGYYAVENTTSNNNGRAVRVYNNSTLKADGSIDVAGDEITSASDKETILLLNYYNNKNSYTAVRTDGQQPKGWEGAFAGNEGTQTIVNRSPKYIQFDVKKKWMYYDENGSLHTVTDNGGMQTKIYVKVELMRKTIKLDGTYNSESDTADIVEDWTSYGQPFLVGYDDPDHPRVNDPNNYGLIYRSGWYWWKSDENQSQGLPLYGYYEENGSYTPVKYYYITRELGVYSDYDGTTPYTSDYSWYADLLPQAWGENRPVVFSRITAQDQDRLVNIQASNLEVQKDWSHTPDNVEEVYFKIWMQEADGTTIIDFTKNMAEKTTGMDSVDYGFVTDKTRLQMLDSGVLVLGITRESSVVLINQIPLLTEKGRCQFWVEEVGYKDSDGNVYLNSTTPGETSTFFAEYDHWNSTTQDWTEWTDTATNNKIQLMKKGNNKIRVKSQPTKDVEVKKQWVDENGNVLEGP